MGSSTLDPSASYYCGPAVISDSTTECEHEIEIHTSVDKNDAVTAWHAIITGRLAHALRFPAGKPVSLLLPDGCQGIGTLVDPNLVKGQGKPPC